MYSQRRDPIKSMILSFLSCGIYQVFWVIRLVRESLTFTDKQGKNTLEILFSIFLPFVGLFLVERKFSEGCARQGIEHTDKAWVYMFLSIIPFGVLLALGFIQAELNKINEILQA